ncbi:MAG TPA: hypothetical protein VF713_00600, partial [Thermoanaerobaculia bacterium]
NVATGVSDGTSTEIKTRNNSTIKEGMKVVAGIASPSSTVATATTGSSASPFTPSGGQQRPGPRGGI